MNIFSSVRPVSNVATQILKKRYFSSGENSWDDVVNRVVNFVVNNENYTKEEIETIRQMILNRYFVPNSPCLVNSGKKNGGLLACFVLPFGDSIEEIYKTKLDFALIAKKGGGCGTTLSNIRPKNSKVSGSTHGFSGGPVDFYDTICKDMEVMTQAGFRGMAQMGVMSVYHPDIISFITVKEEEGKMHTTNLSVGLDSDFMNKVENDETYQTYFDYKDGRVYHETYKARDIFNMIVEGAWRNGEPGIVFLDKMNNSPYKYAGVKIEATNPCFHPDTMIETAQGRIAIKNITQPMMLYSVDSSGELVLRKSSASWISKKNVETIKIKINNGRELIVTPEHNIMSAERGWVRADELIVGEKLVALCRARIGTRYSGVKLSTEDNTAYKMEHRWLYENFYELKIDSNKDVHHKDDDSYNNNITNLFESSREKHSSLTRHSVPNDNMAKGTDGKFISTNSGYKKPIIQMPYDLRSDFPYAPQVVEITSGPTTDVYDISVEGTNNMIANYIVAHNCGEQPLPPYGSCNLGSLDLSKFYSKDLNEIDYAKLEVAVRLATRFLDSVIDANTFPTKEIEDVSVKARQIGLGPMGLSDYFLMKEIAYGSDESIKELKKIMEFIYETSKNESEALGKRFGIPEWCQNLPTPRRNITLISVAPTGTISLIAGCNSGIEPIFSEITIRNDKTGTYQFESDLSSKDYFRCAVSSNGAKEVTWEEHVRIQAAAQEYTDSGVSKTINFPNHTRRETIYKAFIEGWKLGVKGMTVYRNGSRKVEVLSPKNLKKDKCPVCESDIIKYDKVKKCSKCDWFLDA